MYIQYSYVGSNLGMGLIRLLRFGADNVMYRVTLVVADLVWVDLNFDIPLSAKFC